MIRRCNPIRRKVWARLTIIAVAAITTIMVNYSTMETAHATVKCCRDQHLSVNRTAHYFSTEDIYNSYKNVSNIKLPSSLRAFRSSLTTEQMRQMRLVFNAATSLLKQLNIPYILTQGSLIGAHLHHNIIPWDDDLDVIVDVKYKKRLADAFINNTATVNGTQLKFTTLFAGRTWKIYLATERKFSKHFSNPFWPFLDIFPYRDHGDVIRQFNRPRHVFRKDKLYPLKWRPFEGSLQPVPCDTDHILKHVLFNPKYAYWCKSRSYNHIARVRIARNRNVRCEILHRYYPFVKRTRGDNGRYDVEQLVVNDIVLAEYKFDQPRCGETNVRL